MNNICLNIIPACELSTSHLIKEYKEIHNVISQHINTKNAPIGYCVGEDNIKWARKHSLFVLNRYKELCDEISYRGFVVNYPYENLVKVYNTEVEIENKNDYIPTDEDIDLNRCKIIEKIKKKPMAYTWNTRQPPFYYLKLIDEDIIR